MSESYVVSKAVQDAKNAVFQGLSRYRNPYSRELEGKCFELLLDGGGRLILSFPMRDRVLLTESDGSSHLEEAKVMKSDDLAYFILTEISGSSPRRGYMIVLDLREKLFTAVFAKMGAVPERPELVTREVRFGAIADGENALPKERHHFTDDLAGHKIEWVYSPDFMITHVYLPGNYYTIAIGEETKRKIELEAEADPEKKAKLPVMDPYYEEDCLYIKIRENLYLFSFVEKNGGGTQGMMLINTDRITDVGCFWGTAPEGGNESYLFSAYGRWVPEHLPQDDTLKKLGLDIEACGKTFEEKSFEGLSQYKSPSVTELSGKSFYLMMDDLEDGALTFNSGEILTWAANGRAPVTERYDCLKVDEDTYLVNTEITGAKPRTGVSLVLDLEQNLVTAVLAHTGTSKRYPDLVTNQVVFGAIKRDGMPLPKKRHGFTSDLLHSRITWRYNSGPMAVTHVYFDANYIRVPLPKDDDDSEIARMMRETPYDERCYYVKIKKNIYLISFLENNFTYRGNIGNNLLVLMDISRLHDVGRSFGLAESGRPENYTFSAIGRWMDAEEEDMRQSPYRV